MSTIAERCLFENEASHARAYLSKYLSTEHIVHAQVRTKPEMISTLCLGMDHSGPHSPFH